MTIEKAIAVSGLVIGQYSEGKDAIDITFRDENGRTDVTQKCPEDAQDLIELWLEFANENNFDHNGVICIMEGVDW